MDTRLLFGIILTLPFATEAAPTICSCYSIHEQGVTWSAARKSCQDKGGDLVSMETEHEWQVLKDHIQTRTNKFNNSWHIGLRINSSGNWTWVNGKPLTINRWQPGQPRDGAPNAVMVQNHPQATKGLFNDVRRYVPAGFICEKPVVCSKLIMSGVICKDPGKAIQIKTAQRTQSSKTSQLPTRKRTSTAETTKRGKTESVIMVEQARPPSGYIHWTVTVIPLSSVILVLLWVIVLLLWRLKHRTRKQDGDITVKAMQYDVQTRSILNNPEGKAKKGRSSNNTRVRFQEPNNHNAPKSHTSEQTTQNTDGPDCTQFAGLQTNLVDCSIPRRLAIKRKNYKEIDGKFPLNKSEDGVENKGDCSIPARRLAIRRKNSKGLEDKYPLNKSENVDQTEEADSENKSTRVEEAVRNSTHEAA